MSMSSNYAAAPHRCNQAAAEEYDRGGLRHGARPAGTGKASELAAVFIVWPGGEIDLVGIAAVSSVAGDAGSISS